MNNQEKNLLSKYTNLTFSFTTRKGGRSQKPYDNNNLAFHVGDKEEDVLRNHRMLARPLRYNPNALIYMRQIHSSKVHFVTKEDNFQNPPECDALITDQPNRPLMVMSADCIPILIYDTQKQAIAAVHAGRAGALNNILKSTLTAMKEQFKSKPEDLIVVLGPSIHVCCYEIGEALAKEIENGMYASALERRDSKVYLDLLKIVHSQLIELGVNEQHIEISDICTSCQHETYFSYRAEHQKTGRQAGLIMLKA